MLENDIIWWLTAIEIPAMSGLFWMVWRVKNQAHQESQNVRDKVDLALAHLQQSLSNFRIDVAQSYAHNNNVKELEKRLISHLLRIEAKLDTTALKTESLKAKTEKTS